MPAIEYEAFEEDRPSYAPAYILSGFLLVGLATIAYHRIPLWPLTLAHAATAAWFGVLFAWLLRYARQRSLFMSHRLVLEAGMWKHTFRYAVLEAPHVEIPVEEIEEVAVSLDSPGGPRRVFVKARSDVDVYFLPPSADPAALVRSLAEMNPRIRFTT